MSLKTSLTVVALVSLVLGIGDVERGNRLYREGRYVEAVGAYRAALEDGEDSPQLQYNLGTALLRLGRYEEAERHLQAALAAVEPELRQRILYNLGNRYLEQARSLQQQEAKPELLDAAVEAYRSALRIDPDDMAAKWNLELALREQEQAGGGGQGGEDEQEQEEGQAGGEGDEPQPGAQSEAPRSPRPDAAPMSREQAEQILNAVEQDERELYQQQLRKGSRDTPVLRDW